MILKNDEWLLLWPWKLIIEMIQLYPNAPSYPETATPWFWYMVCSSALQEIWFAVGCQTVCNSILCTYPFHSCNEWPSPTMNENLFQNFRCPVCCFLFQMKQGEKGGERQLPVIGKRQLFCRHHSSVSLVGNQSVWPLDT